jgi:hypothetical protein
VLDGRAQPAAGRLAPLCRGGVDGALRPLAGLDALGDDQPGVEQAAERPVDHRLRYLPDPAQVAAGRGELRHREAVGRVLADDGEYQPLRQRHLGWRLRRQRR